MDFSGISFDDLRAPLAMMLAHMQLLAVKRLSDSGRLRLQALDAQSRLLMRLLDRCSASRALTPLSRLDLSVMIDHVISELDDVLKEETSRPF